MTVFAPGLKRCKFSKGYEALAHGLHVGSMACRGFAVICVICRLIGDFRIQNVLGRSRGKRLLWETPAGVDLMNMFSGIPSTLYLTSSD